MEPKEEIRQRVDIADLISEYLAIKPAGSGSFKALCPFHSEKTPSFHISRDKQIWHCFGCAKGGDIFAFVMEMDGLDFLGALRLLGKKAGVEVDVGPQREQSEFDKLRELHILATAFYQSVLHTHAFGEVAREYVKRRGINSDLQKTFELGAAPDQWNTLTTALRKRGISDALIEKAGLAKRASSGDLIDRFRNRLMIPLHDPQGRVVGFTGRLLQEESEKTGPKYLNSPETLIYKKSDILYGFHLAKRSMRQENAAIVVEGNLDVIASHGAGVTNVVASSGTALTQAHLSLIQKQSNRLLMCFDSDPAGFVAAQRGIRLAQSMGFDIDVISIPQDIGKDTDDVVKKDPSLWKQLVAAPIPVLQYYIDRWSRELDSSDSRSKRDFAKRVVTELAFTQDAVEREHWLQMVSDMTGVAMDVLQKELSALGRDRASDAVILKPTVQPMAQRQEKLTQQDQFLRFLIGAALYDESLLPDIVSSLNSAITPLLTDSPYLDIYKSLAKLYTHGVEHSSASPSLFEHLSRGLHDSESHKALNALQSTVLFIEAVAADKDAQDFKREVTSHIALLQAHARDARKQQLAAQIRQAEQAGQADRVRELLAEYKSFTH